MSAKGIRDENTDFLFNAIVSLKNVEECYSFFEDLCTIAEIKEMSKRLLAAKMLNSNCVYNKISETTVSVPPLSAVLTDVLSMEMMAIKPYLED